MNAMGTLREICEQISVGKFPENYTLVQARHLIDVYNYLLQGEECSFIEYEIARLLESIGIFVKRKGVGWVASPLVG